MGGPVRLAARRLLAAGLALVSTISTAYGEALSPDDFLILQLRLGRMILSNGVVGYRIQTNDQETACVALEDLVAGLEFAIDVDGDGARGWFIREEQTFQLDLSAQRVSVDGKTLPLAKSDIYDDNGAPCVSLEAAEKWFPIKLSIDFNDAVVRVDSLTPLPIEERTARERRRASLGEQEKTTTAPEGRIEPYAWMRWPSVDASFAATNSNEDRTGVGDIQLASDFLRMEATLFANLNAETGVESVRGALGRRAPGGGMLGILDATEISIGDVAAPQSRLSAGSRTGRGFLISSFALDRPDVFDTTTLRGSLLSGWEVELYRNGVLLGVRSASADGRYEFLGVPVLYGRNEFRLVFYGPQGQVREETRELFVGDSLLSPGESHFLVSASQQEKPTLFGASAPGLADQGGLRLNARFEHGLLQSATIGGGISRFELKNKDETFLDLSARTALGGFGLFLDGSHNLDGGSALAASLQTGGAGVSLVASHEEYFDFDSELITSTGPSGVQRRSRLQSEFAIQAGRSFALPIGVLAHHAQRANGVHEIGGDLRLSSAFRAASFSNTLTAAATLNDPEPVILTGAALFDYKFGPAILRGEVGYNVSPHTEFTRAAATADLRLAEAMGLRGDFAYDMEGGIGLFGLGANYDFGKVNTGAVVRVDTEGGYEAGISLNLSIVRNPLNGAWGASSESSARNGAAVARVFVDHDNDGVFSDGDELAPDAGIKLDGRPSRHAHKSGDAILLHGLEPYQPTTISVDMRTIDDPYLLAPLGNGVAITPRLGAASVVEFALARSGEVVGEVLLDGEGVGDVMLELVNEKGEVALRTRSEFDGFFVFERAPYGAYRMRMAEEQSARLDLHATMFDLITLSAERDVVEGLTVRLAQGPAPSIAPALGGALQPVAADQAAELVEVDRLCQAIGRTKGDILIALVIQGVC